MVVDSSALIAVLFDEPASLRVTAAIARAEIVRISAGNLLETAIVVDNQINPIAGRQLDAYIRRQGWSSSRSPKTRSTSRVRPTWTMAGATTRRG